jgi:hypothetical protein
MSMKLLALLSVAGNLLPRAALAQVPLPPDPPRQEPGPEPGAPLDAPAPLSLEEVAERLRQTESLVLGGDPLIRWSGYIDLGFFVPQGNGAGYAQDFGHRSFPEYAGRFGWLFLGDILAPAVNGRGEPADLGDAPGVDRFDSVNSRGAAGFIVNEANFTLHSSLSPTALVTVSFNLVPRTGHEFRLGDVFDLDLAQIEWLPTASQRTSIFLGKTDSVLGIEYRERKASRRFGVTPSLLARYTTGTALGVKVRSKFGSDEQLVLAAALTNGSNSVETFHFYDETDSNAGKTLSGRASVRLPLPGWLELGLSGSWGAQDHSLSSGEGLWFFGADLIGHLGNLDLKVQWLTGGAPGDETNDAYGLDLDGGGYLEGDYMFGPSFGAIARVEYRNAFVWLGSERAYLTRSWRATLGLRWVWSAQATVRAEYLRNGEYGGVPGIRNDVFTSSLVVSY